MSSKILLVEDSELLRSALVSFLKREKIRPLPTASLNEALDLVEEVRPDLILCDIQLPDGSGLDLIRHLRKEGIRIPIILFTGLPDMALAAEGMKLGAVDFLTKPLDMAHLSRLIHRTLARSEDRVRHATEPERKTDTFRPRLVGRHPAVVEVYKTIGTAAGSSSPVLIRGESGTGKELVAREVHRHSREGKPFVAVNCASLPDSLMEAELFGHEKGAFTRAQVKRQGRFAAARDGTIFLDEIGDASEAFQATILRALQEGEYTPLGSNRPQPFEARIISATHRPLERMVEEKAFRLDLFYRIQVLEIELPPLRDMMSDLPDIVEHLLTRLRHAQPSLAVARVSPEGMDRLQSHGWPGNVRELQNVLERAAMLAGDGAIEPHHLHFTHLPGVAEKNRKVKGNTDLLETHMREHILQLLEECEGNTREAARRLGISPGRLYRILDGKEE